MYASAGQQQRPVRRHPQRGRRERAPTARPATRPAGQGRRPAAVRPLPGRLRCVLGGRSVGRRAHARSNRPLPRPKRPNEATRSVLLSSLAEVARDYIQLRGAQAQLAIARENVRTARQSLDPDAATRRRRRHHRPGRGQRLRPVAHHAGADPDPGAAGSADHQRAEPAAGPAAERPAGRTGDGQAGAAGAAAGAGRVAVGTGAPPSRHSSGRGATACRDRRHRRGGGEFLSVAQPYRQLRAAVAAVQQCLQPQFEAVCARSGPDHPDLPGRPVALHPAAARGAAAGGGGQFPEDRAAGLARCGQRADRLSGGADAAR